MLGGVLEARQIHERRAPNDRLQFVGFNEKGNLRARRSFMRQ